MESQIGAAVVRALALTRGEILPTVRLRLALAIQKELGGLMQQQGLQPTAGSLIAQLASLAQEAMSDEDARLHEAFQQIAKI